MLAADADGGGSIRDSETHNNRNRKKDVEKKYGRPYLWSYPMLLPHYPLLYLGQRSIRYCGVECWTKRNLYEMSDGDENSATSVFPRGEKSKTYPIKS